MRAASRAEPAGPPGPDSASEDRASEDRASEDRASEDRAAFERFVEEVAPRLGRALAAAYGFEDGQDATAEALAYAWQHWPRLQHIENLPGYLFRVGQTRGRRRKRQRVLFEVDESGDHRFEPGLPKALAALTQRQRLAVVLVHGYGCTLREVAEVTGTKPTSVQNHLSRGLARLRNSLGVDDEN